MNIAAIALQLVLGLVFVGAGASKIAGAKSQVDLWEELGLPQWFRPVVGIIEIVGALTIVAGVAVHRLSGFAGVWLAAVMVGAVGTHLVTHHAGRKALPASVLLCASALVAVLRLSSLAP